MASSKKEPYVHPKLLKKVEAARRKNEKLRALKVWSRSSMILPEFVGMTFNVHNGHKFIPVYIEEGYVGHKLGEFSITRTFKAHPGTKKAKDSK